MRDERPDALAVHDPAKYYGEPVIDYASIDVEGHEKPKCCAWPFHDRRWCVHAFTIENNHWCTGRTASSASCARCCRPSTPTCAPSDAMKSCAARAMPHAHARRSRRRRRRGQARPRGTRSTRRWAARCWTPVPARPPPRRGAAAAPAPTRPAARAGARRRSRARILWMTWRAIGGIPAKVHSDLRRFAPEYELRLLDDAACGRLSRATAARRRRAAVALATPAHRFDLWRYCALYVGGVYLDVKSWLIRPLRGVHRGARRVHRARGERDARRHLPGAARCAAPGATIKALSTSSCMTTSSGSTASTCSSSARRTSPSSPLPLAGGRAANAQRTASGQHWIFLNEVAQPVCDVPRDKWGGCFLIRDEARGEVLLRTRHYDYPAAFLPPPRRANAARRASARASTAIPSTRASASRRADRRGGFVGRRSHLLADCQRRCLDARAACAALMYNVAASASCCVASAPMATARRGTALLRKRQPPRKRPHATKRAHRRRQRDAEPTAATDKPAASTPRASSSASAAGWAAPSSRPLGAPPWRAALRVCARRCRASDGRACVTLCTTRSAASATCSTTSRLVPDPQHAGWRVGRSGVRGGGIALARPAHGAPPERVGYC